MKTSELTGAALDWAVAKVGNRKIGFNLGGGLEVRCRTEDGEELPDHWDHWDLWVAWHPSTDWAQGGPIIDLYGISVWGTCGEVDPQAWSAITDITSWGVEGQPDRDESYGPTPLIAAMRCLVASHLGPEVEIPKELQ